MRFDQTETVEENRISLGEIYDSNMVRMEEKTLGRVDLPRCSLRRGSATSCLVVKDFLQRLVLAFSRCTRSVLDWSGRSEILGTTHAAPVSVAAMEIDGNGG